MHIHAPRGVVTGACVMLCGPSTFIVIVKTLSLLTMVVFSASVTGSFVTTLDTSNLSLSRLCCALLLSAAFSICSRFGLPLLSLVPPLALSISSPLSSALYSSSGFRYPSANPRIWFFSMFPLIVMCWISFFLLLLYSHISDISSSIECIYSKQ